MSTSHPYVNKILTLAIMSAGFHLALPSQAIALTIQEAVEQTLNTNPEILDARARSDAAQERIKQAMARYFPSVDLSLGFGPEVTNNSTTRGRGLTSEDLMRKESGISISQMLFDGFQVKNSVEQARSQFQSAEYLFKNDQERLAMQAIKVYLETLLQQELLELIKDNVKLHQSILKKVKVRTQSGISGKEDVHQTESRLTLASAKLSLRQAAYENARESFEKTIGTLPDGLAKPAIRVDLLPKTKFEAVEKAKKEHLGLLSFQSELDAAQFYHNAVKSSYFPKINLELSALNNSDIGGVPDESNSAAAIVRMRYNLFNGGGDVARDDEARNRLQQAQEQLNVKQREVIEATKVTWNEITLSQKRVEFLKNHTKESQQVSFDYHSQFKMGKRSLLDVLNSENELFEARSAYITEQYTLIRNIYQLMSNMGQLLGALKIPAPEDSVIASPAPMGKEPTDDSLTPASERLSDTYAEYNRQAALQQLRREHLPQAPIPEAFGIDPKTMAELNAAAQVPGTVPSAAPGSGLTPMDVLFIRGVLERLMAPYQQQAAQLPAVSPTNGMVPVPQPIRPPVSEPPQVPERRPVPEKPVLPAKWANPEPADTLQQSISTANPVETSAESAPQTQEVKSEPIPKPTDPEPAKESETFTVEVGRFSRKNMEYAQRVKKNLKDFNLELHDETVMINGQPYMHLYFGPFATRDEAEIVADVLQKDKKLDSISVKTHTIRHQ